jgi:hypothetical protein
MLIRIMNNLVTTVGGLIAGAATGAAYAAYNGEWSKEALIAGAAVGLVGAVVKDPEWVKKLMNQKGGVK